MSIFGICFILYFLKLSACRGFCSIKHVYTNPFRIVAVKHDSKVCQMKYVEKCKSKIDYSHPVTRLRFKRNLETMFREKAQHNTNTLSVNNMLEVK